MTIDEIFKEKEYLSIDEMVRVLGIGKNKAYQLLKDIKKVSNVYKLKRYSKLYKKDYEIYLKELEKRNVENEI